jgi:carbonic anhydrase
MEIAGESLEVHNPLRVAPRAPGIAVSSEELLRRHEAGGGRLAASNARSAAAVPALRTVVVTCMDARIDVQALFGLGLGEVHTLRNAGGVVTDDVVRSVVISQRKLGTREVLVVAHSRCGMATFSDEDFSEELALEVGMRPLWRTYAFADPAVDVQRGVARLRRDPFLLPETVVRGFVLDIESFALTEVGGDEPAGVAGVRDSA